MTDEEVYETERAALLFDIHGNAEALEAVVEDAAERGLADLVFGGDYASKGPRPNASVRRTRSLASAAIRGNTDEWVTGAEDPPDPQGVEWTREHLTSDQCDWLDSRPFGCRLRPASSDDPSDDLLVVHANPSDILTPLILEEHPYEEWPVTPEEQVESLLDGVTAELIAFGHVHNPASATLAGQRLRSVGSVGFPWDGDQRAAYGVAEWTGEEWRLEDVRVEYDHESVAGELERSGAPGSEEAAESIRTASFDPLA